MNLDKYNNDGWGISKTGFEKIIEILNSNKFSDIEKYNIVEFGSGFSTEFFVDYIQENNLNNVFITSFENDTMYMTKAKHPQLKLCLRKLITCSDFDYNNMFVQKTFNPCKVSYLIKSPETRQKNCFYHIEENDIPNSIDFMLLDGPSGNGRNLAFLHTLNKLHKDSIVFIDDYNHYDFVQKFKSLYNCEEIYEKTDDYGCYIILKVL